MERCDSADELDDLEFVEFFERFDALMREAPSAALSWVETAPPSLRDESHWVLCKAEAMRAAENAEAAVAYLSGVLAVTPDFADAHYALAELEQELGHEREAIVHQLETLRLDNMVDLIAESVTADLADEIAKMAERTLSELPGHLLRRLIHVPVLLQSRPSECLVADGFDARALGLFEGPNLSEVGTADAMLGPTSVTLFSNCLIDAFGDDEAELLEQVRVTVLHEVGHYFCLDEEQLAALGLG